MGLLAAHLEQLRHEGNPAEGHYLIPVAPGRLVTISGPWPLTEAEWGRFTMILELFRPALVEGYLLITRDDDTDDDNTTPNTPPW